MYVCVCMFKTERHGLALVRFVFLRPKEGRKEGRKGGREGGMMEGREGGRKRKA